MIKRNLDTYKIWAPAGALWTPWAKPVLFAIPPAGEVSAPVLPDVDWTAAADYRSMVILDLPGSAAVEEGLALGRMGYRPVPLYNGVGGPGGYVMLVDVKPIVASLYAGADLLEGYVIRPDAPPVFLLDANRMQGGVNRGLNAGKYDNRWCVFPQDVPSADFLRQQGIERVIVRTAVIQSDLAHVLRRYQEQGIQIRLCRDGGMSEAVTVQRPSRFGSLFYRAQVLAGLTRNPAGGFGGPVPVPTESSGGSSGVRYYGRIG